jgi:hypothetical protein
MLPHITLLDELGGERFRLRYESLELGVYRVRITCDLQVRVDRPARVLLIDPFPAAKPVKAEAGWHSLSAQGSFASRSRFLPAGNQTRVEYDLALQAELPTPAAAHIIPDSVRRRAARSIAGRRIQEIADGFIGRSIAAFLQKS